MLSILIPVYNYDCSELVAALDKQAVRLNINYEILVADDASEESFRQRNRVINDTSVHRGWMPMHCRISALMR